MHSAGGLSKKTSASAVFSLSQVNTDLGESQEAPTLYSLMLPCMSYNLPLAMDNKQNCYEMKKLSG